MHSRENKSQKFKIKLSSYHKVEKL